MQVEQDITYAARLRGFLEKSRVATRVHLSHLELQGRDDALARTVLPMLEAIEDTIEDRIREWAETTGAWMNWGLRVKGCGALTLGAVMARADITRLGTVSAMWAHFGFAPGQKLTKGEKLTYDPTGKTWCWRVGSQLLKATDSFYALYLERKEYETVRAGPGPIVKASKGKKLADNQMTAQHIHNRAMRYMIKAFLACLWKVWREAEGLPIPEPYQDALIGDRVHENPKREAETKTTSWDPERFTRKEAKTNRTTSKARRAA